MQRAPVDLKSSWLWGQHSNGLSHCTVTSQGGSTQWHPLGPSHLHHSTCIWCGRAAHSSRWHCPTSNDTCHGCGRCRHWQQVCRASSANVYLTWSRTSQVNHSPLTLSHMMYIKFHPHRKVSLLTLTSARLLPNHCLSSNSDSRLTQAAPVTPYMFLTWTISCQSRWTRLATWLLKGSHSNHRTSHSSVHSPWKSVWDCCTSHHCTALLSSSFGLGWTHPTGHYQLWCRHRQSARWQSSSRTSYSRVNIELHQTRQPQIVWGLRQTEWTLFNNPQSWCEAHPSTSPPLHHAETIHHQGGIE